MSVRAPRVQDWGGGDVIRRHCSEPRMLTRTPESPPHSSRLAPQCSAATAAATAAASDADAIARADVLPAQQSAASLATSSAPPATATATAGSAATAAATRVSSPMLQPQHGQGDVCLYVRTRPGSVSCPFHVFLRIFKKNMLQKWPFLRCGGGRILAGFC